MKELLPFEKKRASVRVNKEYRSERNGNRGNGPRAGESWRHGERDRNHSFTGKMCLGRRSLLPEAGRIG